MTTTKREAKETLDEMVSQHGLTAVIRWLAELSSDRADTGGEDDSNADAWDEAAVQLDDCADQLPEGV